MFFSFQIVSVKLHPFSNGICSYIVPFSIVCIAFHFLADGWLVFHKSFSLLFILKLLSKEIVFNNCAKQLILFFHLLLGYRLLRISFLVAKEGVIVRLALGSLSTIIWQLVAL